MERSKEMDRWLDRVGRRVRLRRALRTGAGTWVVGGFGALLIALGARLIPLGWEQAAALWVITGSLIIGLATGLLRPLPAKLVSRAADRDLGSRDRVATAYEFSGRPSKGDIADSLVDSTTRWVGGQPPRLAAPLRVPRRRVLLGLGMSAAAAVILFLPNPLDDVIRQRNADRELIDQKADEIRREAERFESAEIDPAQKKEITEELESLADRLEEAGSLEEALEEVARYDGRLAGLARSEHLRTKTLLRNFERSVGERPLNEQTSGEPSQQLRQLAEAIPNLTAGERNEASERLSDLASSLQGSDPELSEALINAAEALQEGSDGEALEEAADELDQAEGRIGAQEALSDARASLGDIRSDLSAGESGEQPGEGSADGSQDGQGSGASGSQTGKGAGAPSGQVGGTNAPTGSSARGGQGSPSGSGNNPSVGVQESEVYDPVFGDEAAERLRAEGDVREGGRQTTIDKGPGLGEEGDVMVPYRYVYPAWSSRASRTVETLPIPASLRSFVRAYFSSLAPENP